MRKQDIAIPRTVQAVEQRSQSARSAIERKVEQIYIRQDSEQITEILRNFLKDVLLEDNGLAIDNGCIHNTQGEKIQYKTTLPVIGETTAEGFLFYFIGLNGIKCRICSTNDFNATIHKDYTIFEVIKLLNN